MTYELALQLKEAGYPQEVKGGNYWHVINSELHDGGQLYVPTLEELIEACGEGFVALTHYNTSDPTAWRAEAHIVVEDMSIPPPHKRGGIIQAKGSTPSEAVARLYLALQTQNRPIRKVK